MVSGTILTIRFIALHMNWIAHHGVRLIGRAAYLKYTQSRIPAVLLFGCRISCTYAPTHFKNGCYLYANTMYGARPGCTHTGDDPTAYPSLPNISSFSFIFWLFLRLIGKKADFLLPESIKNTKQKLEMVFPTFWMQFPRPTRTPIEDGLKIPHRALYVD